MPLMAGSARVVLDSCHQLPASSLPKEGIGWGDISTNIERQAGFREEIGRMVEGVRYPGIINEEQPFYDYVPYTYSIDTEPLVGRVQL